jgi:tetratricopeptide (TPR) repeat protein
MPEVIAAITGRFDRFPPLYYEMRLERVTSEVATTPGDLALYDDAAVACDRLGRHDEAIGWMSRKADQLAAAPDLEHHYRYLANLGTFHAHRWIARGADRSDLSDLTTAETLIVQAIELNPDAHFGRERYQLLAIRWLLNPPPSVGFAPSIFCAEPTLCPLVEHSWLDAKRLEQSGYADAAEGLTGLVVLGNAWNSPDIYAALRTALIDRGDASVAYLAFLRIRDLESEGRTTLHPDGGPHFSNPEHYLYQTTDLDAYYSDACREASDWQEARNDYMVARLQAGRHPDTDSSFWSEWRPASNPPTPPGSMLPGGSITLVVIALVILGFIGLPTLAVGISLFLYFRRRKAHAQPVG